MRWFAIAIVLLCSPLLAGCGSSSTKADAPGAGQHLTNADWGAVEANPDAYAGATVVVVGKVYDVSKPRGGGAGTIHVWADPQLNGQPTVVSAPTGRHVAVGQYVRVRGVVASDQSSTAGASPVVDAHTINVVSGLAARSPTLRSTFGNRFTLRRVSFHPYRIEFAKDETRVFIWISNHTKYGIQLNDPNTYFVQHGQTYHPASSNLDYPQLPSTIPPGGRGFGVVVFPAMSTKTRGMRLYFDVDSVDPKGGNVSVIWTWTT